MVPGRYISFLCIEYIFLLHDLNKPDIIYVFIIHTKYSLIKTTTAVYMMHTSDKLILHVDLCIKIDTTPSKHIKKNN